jgi:mono/diheme cytochrome c family protein
VYVARWAAIVLAIGAFALSIYVARTWDRVWDAPLPDIHASTDPAVIKRGEYLVFGPSHCVECHVGSWEEYEQASERGERPALRGGIRFAAAPLGAVYSKNLTPDPETGIGRYTDPEIARLLRYAVRPNGRATVRPLMPFELMSDADLTAIVSYLRAQPPVRSVVPANEWTLIGKVVKSLSPTFRPRTAVSPYAAAPEQRATKERGEYLARSVANCTGCHSPRSQLTFAVNGPEFSGGNPMEPAPLQGADPSIWFRPPNITPANGSALKKFPDRDTFVARFLRGGRQHAGSPMPWECFSRMSPEDVGALYEYLHSVPAADGPSGDPRVRQSN